MKILVMILFIISISTAFAFAAEQPEGEPKKGIVLPEVFKPHEETIRSEVDKQKHVADFFEQDYEVQYNEDGHIEKVSYEDGTEFSYSYQYDQDGELVGCQLMSNRGLGIQFTRESAPGQTGGPEISVTIFRLLEIGESQRLGDPATGGDDISEERVVVIYKTSGLRIEDIARTPMKFDVSKMQDILAEASEEKQKALREYFENTESYYEKVSDELREHFDALASETDLGTAFDGLEETGAMDAERRKLIDDAVQLIRSEAENAEEGEKPATEEFLSVEEAQRMEVIGPQRAIYDGKIEEILKTIHAMIDTLLSSKLALYLNLQKDKIETIINLPKKEEDKS
jgi:hypothetical protein